MRVAGVNGIRTHGAANIDRLLLELRIRGLETVDIRLPRRFISARWAGEEDGYLVAEHTVDGDILVAHSFGCIRAFHAHRVREYEAVFCIAPAMEREVEWRYPERVHCYHSKDDWAVWFGTKLLFHPFGPAGNHGFTQKAVVNHNYDGAGHNDYFVGSRMQRIADQIASTESVPGMT